MADSAAVERDANKQFWLPLESNPEVLNGFAAKLQARDSYVFHDVYGLDDELLAMVPKPCVAVLLLFPSDEMRAAKAAQLERLRSESYAPEPGIFFMKQYVGNACGTIAAVHALTNNDFLIAPETELAAFLRDNAPLAPEERGASLARAQFVSAATSESAQGGQTTAPEIGSDVNHHFITFIAHNNHIYELDGTKPYPINHGDIIGEDLLTTAAGVIKREFVAHVPDGHFNVMALAATD